VANNTPDGAVRTDLT